MATGTALLISDWNILMTYVPSPLFTPYPSRSKPHPTTRNGWRAEHPSVTRPLSQEREA